MLTADFDGNLLRISFEHLGDHPAGVGHNYGEFGMAFADLDWVGTPGRIVNLIPDPNNTLPISGLAFGDDTIDVDFMSVNFPPGRSMQTAQFSIVTEHIPEPGTGTSAVVAVGTLILFVRRRRRK